MRWNIRWLYGLTTDFDGNVETFHWDDYLKKFVSDSYKDKYDD